MLPHRTPGQLLADLLEKRGWTQNVLSVVLGINKATISQIVAGKRDLDAELALKLGAIFDVPAEDFMELQKSYALERARITWQPDPALSRRAELFGALPITEMINRRWLPLENAKDTAKVEAAVVSFFGVSAVENLPVLPHAAKKTNPTAEVTPAQRAWLQRVRQIASEMVVPKYSHMVLRAALPKLSELLLAPEEARHVPRILTEAGVRYVIVESLTGAKIDGACLWLDDASPVLGMSLRYDRFDNFWFVLRHELEHVLRGHGRGVGVLDADLQMEGDPARSEELPEEERQASAAAASFCVPQKDLESFIARKNPFFADRDLVGFAAKRRIHPSLVAGQIRYRVKRWDLFTKHNTKVRYAVAPGAIVDGWGDVAPVHQMRSA
jgi:HTH-type transcriptional regulator/antitoxin HigA